MVLSPETAIFYCEASGVLTPNITWRMNGETVESESKDITILIDSTGGIITNSTLQILNTLAIHTGTYTCVATNAAGSDTASAELAVNCMLYLACTLSFYFLTGPNNNYFNKLLFYFMICNKRNYVFPHSLYI